MEVAAKSFGTSITAKGYVQDGLVEMWDAIENNGWRKHDYGMTRWKGLVHGIELWNNFKFDEDFAIPLTFPFLTAADNTLAGHYTSDDDVSCIDACISFAPTLKESIIYVGTGYASVYSCTCVYNINGLQLFVSNRSIRIKQQPELGETCKLNFTCQRPMSTNRSFPYFADAYLNAKLVGSETDSSQWKSYFDSKGVYITVKENPSGLKIHCLRRYKKRLSAEEILHNYEIDKERFKI